MPSLTGTDGGHCDRLVIAQERQRTVFLKTIQDKALCFLNIEFGVHHCGIGHSGRESSLAAALWSFDCSEDRLSGRPACVHESVPR